ncbi:MAG: M56 family metallopeptidase [Chitinophagaceae bacterium]
MSTLIIYLLKANIALTLFYLAYRFGLRRLTFYTLNRFFLVFGIVFSATFPLVNLNVFFQHYQHLAGSVTYYGLNWNLLPQYVQQQDPFTVWSLITFVFWTGVIVMTVRFWLQMFSLLRIHLRTKAGLIHQEKVRLMYDRLNPFSFFKNIYINPELHSAEELENILLHEKIHIKGWHSADVLAGEINNIFYWFNPGAWLMKTAIQENLEFVTDRKIIRSGIDAKSYQYSLIKVSFIPFAVPIANNFNFSHIKMRIKMMNKKRSSGFHLLRYLLLLPILTIVVLVMSSSERQDTSAKMGVNKTLMGNMIVQSRDSIPLPYSANALPPDYINFLQRNPSVKSLEWYLINNMGPALIHIVLKNGKVESYHLNNPEERKKAEAKYGNFPAPPPPPPPARAKSNTSVNTSEATIGNDRYYAQLSYKKAREKDYSEAESYANKSLKLNPDNKKAASVLRYVHQMKEDRKKMEAYKNERGNESASKVTPAQKDDAHYAQLSYQQAREKDYEEATLYAQKSLQLNPHNATAKQVLRYVNQMKGFQKKMEEYEKAHKDMDSAPAHAVNFNYPINDHGPLSETSSGIMTLFPAPPVDQAFGANQTLPKTVIGERYYGYNLKGATKNTMDTPLTHTIASRVNYGIKDTTKFPLKNVLYLVNGKKVERTYIQKLDPQNISSISVLKGKSAIHEYGPTAKDGVIKIL